MEQREHRVGIPQWVQPLTRVAKVSSFVSISRQSTQNHFSHAHIRESLCSSWHKEQVLVRRLCSAVRCFFDIDWFDSSFLPLSKSFLLPISFEKFKNSKRNSRLDLLSKRFDNSIKSKQARNIKTHLMEKSACFNLTGAVSRLMLFFSDCYWS